MGSAAHNGGCWNCGGNHKVKNCPDAKPKKHIAPKQPKMPPPPTTLPPPLPVHQNIMDMDGFRDFMQRYKAEEEEARLRAAAKAEQEALKRQREERERQEQQELAERQERELRQQEEAQRQQMESRIRHQEERAAAEDMGTRLYREAAKEWAGFGRANVPRWSCGKRSAEYGCCGKPNRTSGWP